MQRSAAKLIDWPTCTRTSDHSGPGPGVLGHHRPEGEVGHNASMTDHAVLVHLSAASAAGLDLYALEDSLIEAIDVQDAGEFDGNEFGPEGVVLYMYGPDADALWSAVEPVLRGAGLSDGSHAIKRFGEPGAPEVRIDLG